MRLGVFEGGRSTFARALSASSVGVTKSLLLYSHRRKRASRQVQGLECFSSPPVPCRRGASHRARPARLDPGVLHYQDCGRKGRDICRLVRS